MKISAQSVEVLKNFSTLNPGIEFKEGDTLSTISASRAVLAKVQVPDSFEKGFCVHDLKQFLGVLGLFKEPELEFHDTYLTVSEGGSSTETVNYRYGKKEHIVTPPAKELNFPDPDVEFDLTADAIAKIQSAGSALGLSELAIVGENGEISVRAINSKEQNSNNYKFVVGATDLEFKAVFKSENLKLLPDDYNVAISSKGFAKFQSQKARYFVAIEANASSF